MELLSAWQYCTYWLDNAVNWYFNSGADKAESSMRDNQIEWFFNQQYYA